MTHIPPHAVGDASQQQLESNDTLKDVPKGALALAGAAVGLLVIAWLLMYFVAFLPRGAVG